MSRKHPRPAEDSQQVRDLLRRYACPVPYHEVRTRFLGNIATPKLSASPLNVTKGLWGGAFPEVELIEDLNRLIDALINGLWNALTIHQKRSEPFRLVKLPLEPSVANLARLALVRRQELDGFVEGLFDGAEAIDLPETGECRAGRSRRDASDHGRRARLRHAQHRTSRSCADPGDVPASPRTHEYHGAGGPRRGPRLHPRTPSGDQGSHRESADTSLRMTIPPHPSDVAASP